MKQYIFNLVIFPRNKTAQPRLLEDLTNELRAKLRKAEMLASTKGHNIKKHSVPSNLQFQAHQEVFEMFIRAFPSYAPLLFEIKEVLDNAIEGGIKCAFENVSLRMKLDAIEQEQDRAVTQSRAEIAKESSEERRKIYEEILQMMSRQQKAEQKIAPTKQRLQQLLEEDKQLDKQLSLEEQKVERLQKAVGKELTWATSFKELSQRVIKPFTTTDEEEVFGESSAIPEIEEATQLPPVTLQPPETQSTNDTTQPPQENPY